MTKIGQWYFIDVENIQTAADKQIFSANMGNSVRVCVCIFHDLEHIVNPR